ncbi:type IX secretion system protein PorG [Pararhodonellum marinum]|uniref:type IX secretion system protein PorG n=1 Tax=Pararhodonellum marinum TaxID=2755358 RepID=UPI001E36521D|nr:DUF6089 family protein [Pararhodonellum marinum]
MKKVKLHLVGFMFTIALFSGGTYQLAFAQQHEVGLGLGVATYTGDIIRRIDPTQVGLQGSLFGRRNFDNVWSIRAGIAIARLNAADSIRPIDPVAELRNAGFRGTAVEGHLIAEFHFLNYLSPNFPTNFSPYGFMGFGYTIFTGNGQAYEGDPFPGRYSLSTPVIPFGLGIKYQIKDRLFASLELGIRATVSDYLDKIEYNETYIRRFDPDTGALNPNSINFGTQSDKDWYYFLGITVSYSFHQVKCYQD